MCIATRNYVPQTLWWHLEQFAVLRYLITEVPQLMLVRYDILGDFSKTGVPLYHTALLQLQVNEQKIFLRI